MGGGGIDRRPLARQRRIGSDAVMSERPAFDRRRFLAAGAAWAPFAGLLPGEAAAPRFSAGRRRLKLSLAAYSFRDHLDGKKKPAFDLPAFVDRAAALDVDAVELTEYWFPKPPGHDWVTAIKRRCHLAGVDISCAPMRSDLTVTGDQERAEQIGAIRSWLEVAALLGAPAVRVFAGNQKKGQSVEEAESRCIEALREAAVEAARVGIFLALENHGGIVAESSALLRIVAAVDSPWVAINLDTGNFHTDDPYADFAACASLAVAVQVKTRVQRRGKAPEMPDIARFMGILRDAGYRGAVALEYEGDAAIEEVPWRLGELRRHL